MELQQVRISLSGEKQPLTLSVSLSPLNMRTLCILTGSVLCGESTLSIVFMNSWTDSSFDSGLFAPKFQKVSMKDVSTFHISRTSSVQRNKI